MTVMAVVIFYANQVQNFDICSYFASGIFVFQFFFETINKQASPVKIR